MRLKRNSPRACTENTSTAADAEDAMGMKETAADAKAVIAPTDTKETADADATKINML